MPRGKERKRPVSAVVKYMVVLYYDALATSCNFSIPFMISIFPRTVHLSPVIFISHIFTREIHLNPSNPGINVYFGNLGESKWLCLWHDQYSPLHRNMSFEISLRQPTHKWK